MEALSKITAKGLPTLSSMAIKNAKHHIPLIICHNFAMIHMPDDSMRRSRSVVASVSP
jgi:hypothetical protein